MITESGVRRLLAPFELNLTTTQLGQLLTYLELLMRWNRKFNLTAVRTVEECVTRHFGESLYLAPRVELQSEHLDIGSGAGFPGLALRIAFPQVSTTLLEPVAKKRAFLKEVARACGIGSVQVRAERLEELLLQDSAPSFDTATARAVGRVDELVPQAARCLKPGSRLCLWLSRKQATAFLEPQPLIQWGRPIAVPLSQQREIWVGTRTSVSPAG